MAIQSTGSRGQFANGTTARLNPVWLPRGFCQHRSCYEERLFLSWQSTASKSNQLHLAESSLNVSKRSYSRPKVLPEAFNFKTLRLRRRGGLQPGVAGFFQRFPGLKQALDEMGSVNCHRWCAFDQSHQRRNFTPGCIANPSSASGTGISACPALDVSDASDCGCGTRVIDSVGHDRLSFFHILKIMAIRQTEWKPLAASNLISSLKSVNRVESRAEKLTDAMSYLQLLGAPSAPCR